MTATDELLARNEHYRASFDKGSLPLPPAKKVAGLACMDARLDPAKVTGKRRTRSTVACPGLGQAHRVGGQGQGGLLQASWRSPSGLQRSLPLHLRR
jgi:hypothetical protein